MSLPSAPLATAQQLVRSRYPDAQQAWLAGSVVAGDRTSTSDLDITILMPEDTTPHRVALSENGWPVEVFVHTQASLVRCIERDLAQRRPTVLRLVGNGIPLVPGGGSLNIQTLCEERLAAGPPVVPPEILDDMRYHLTDQLDDLMGLTDRSAGLFEDIPVTGTLVDAAAVEVWRTAAEFVLAVHHWWSGTGKWLMRELHACDHRHDTTFAVDLHDGLREAVAGNPHRLAAVTYQVLALKGGRLWEGHTRNTR